MTPKDEPAWSPAPDGLPRGVRIPRIRGLPASRQPGLLLDAWAVVAVLLACTIVVISRVLASHAVLDAIIVSGDSLQPALFAEDLMRHADAWRNFRQAQIPSLIPDVAIYTALQILSGNWRIAAFVFAILGFLAYVGVGAWIAMMATRARFATTLLVFALLATCFELYLVRRVEQGLPDANALYIHVPLFHGGPMLLSLILAGLAIRQLCLPRHMRLAAIGAISALLGSGDLVTGPQLIVPLLLIVAIAVATRAVPPGTAIALAGTMVIGFGIGAVALLWIPRSYGGVSWSGIPGNAVRFVAELPSHFVWCVMLGLLLCACLAALLVWRRSAGPKRFHGAAVWWLLGSVAGLATLAVTVCFYQDGGSYRYAVPAIAWLTILMTVLAAPQLERQGHLLTPAIATLVLGAATVDARWVVPPLLDWHLPLERCLQDAPRRGQLRAGLADYWQARALEASSDWRLQVDQIQHEGPAQIWENDPMRFLRDDRNETVPPPYSFIVMAGLDTNAITALYGSPDQLIKCPQSDVWIYFDARRLQGAVVAHSAELWPFILRSTGALTIPGMYLAARHGEHQVDGMHASNSAEHGGDLTFGPYLTLPAGRWRVSLTYRLSATTQAHASWRLTANAGAVLLASASLPPADGMWASVATTFVLPQPVYQFEVVTSIDAPGQIVVQSVHVSAN